MPHPRRLRPSVKGVKAQIPKDSDPRGMLELNRPGAQIFIDPNPALQSDWEECWTAANAAAQGSAA